MDRNDTQARIAREARDAAARGETLAYACPYPFGTVAAQQFKAAYLEATEPHAAGGSGLLAAAGPAVGNEWDNADELAAAMEHAADFPAYPKAPYREAAAALRAMAARLCDLTAAAPASHGALEADVSAVVGLLESQEWAEHCTKTRLGQRLEAAVTELHNAIHEAAERADQTTTAPPGDADGSTPGPWFVRKGMRGGEMIDCWVAAPDVNGFAYDAEILGDDEYRGDMKRKLADCELIAKAVNAARCSHAPAAEVPRPGDVRPIVIGATLCEDGRWWAEDLECFIDPDDCEVLPRAGDANSGGTDA